MIIYGRSRMTLDPSHPHNNAGTEHVGGSTDQVQTLLARTKREAKRETSSADRVKRELRLVKKRCEADFFACQSDDSAPAIARRALLSSPPYTTFYLFFTDVVSPIDKLTITKQGARLFWGPSVI